MYDNPIDVQYRPSINHQLADGVSRLRLEGESADPVEYKACFAVQLKGEEQNPRQGTVHGEDPRRPGDAEHAFAVVPEERDVSSVTVEVFQREQAEDPFCRSAAETVGNPDSRFDVDRHRFLARNSPLDRTLQPVVPKRLRAKVLYIANHPDSQDDRAVRRCITPSAENIIGLTWLMMPSVPYGIACHALLPGEP